MSTPASVGGDCNPKTTNLPAFVHTSESLRYTVIHVFLPIRLPNKSDYTAEKEFSLARAVCASAHAYGAHVSETSESWHRITRMLDNLQSSVQSERLDRDHVISQLCGMQTGDVLALPIRTHNTAIILTKREDCTLFESFEVSPHGDVLERTTGPLICSYPGFVVEVPNKMFDNTPFQYELANSVCCQTSTTDPGPSPPPLAHAQYVTALFSGILQSVDCTQADVPRIVKRVRDDVKVLNQSPWRRSPIWLLIRVAIQMSIDRSLGRASYKAFILFFICTIARDANVVIFTTDLLHLMASKILRRLRKLGSFIPDWLSQIALKACAGLREVLDARWITLSTRSSSFRNPSQDELMRDMQLSLEHSRKHICNALANHDHGPIGTPFRPNHRRRGTIDDFLSSDVEFFDRAYDADPVVTLYDVERSVEDGIDDWFACVTNVDEACTHLEILMDKYMIDARRWYRATPETQSILLLTGIELFVALDRLIVEDIPMFADYSPEIPVAFLEGLLLRRTTSLHRLSRAYRYLSTRHSRSRPGWSVLSDAFTQDSFAVRYYDQSPHLQELRARIEEDTMVNHDGRQEDPQYPSTEAEVSQSPLPVLPLHAKVVVFELQCPACIRAWRSAAARILHYFYDATFRSLRDEREGNLLSRASSTLQRYFIGHEGPPLHVQIHFAYLHSPGSHSRDGPTLRYAVRYPNKFRAGVYVLRTWQLKSWQSEPNFSFWQTLGPGRLLSRCVNSTSHTSNDVLAAQADCPTDFTLDEFIAFGHLRSGGTLQWANILQGLRSRTLNLRRRYFHFLLTTAVLQVGPFDLDTGTWTWHQDLQETSFCNALLDELESLSTDVRAGSIDGTMMNTISLLVTRVLASSPSEAVSERAIAILQSVRKKTFKWVQELSYNLAVAPTNEERSQRLLDMAATCRSTFEVESSPLSMVFQSAEDIDAALSCAFLVLALHPQDIVNEYRDEYLRLLLQRDRRLSFSLERVLRDVILADPSDYGVDLAVCKIFPSHKPGTNRWEQLQHPNARWLTCQTKVTADQPSQVVYLSLLDRELRVDGQLSCGLPRAIRGDPEFQQIFHDQGFFLTRSNLPGMDFTTLTAMSKHKVHFSLRGDNLVIQAKSNESKDILELIPSNKLRGDLPSILVDGHVHWLNLSTRTIEIRPVKQLWEQSPGHWKIDYVSGHYRVHKGYETLVNVHSSTWAMISQCFKSLHPSGSSSENILTTILLDDSLESTPVLQLSVELRRYGLFFFVNGQGELESRDFKDMVYDENQCIGALYGLEHLLVLRQNSRLPVELIPRCVLVPNGFPRIHDRYCVRVDYGEDDNTIEPGEPLYHAYTVDTELGCLVGSGSLTSMQYLAELHALTNCDRPDPLTGKMGAQAAHFLLQSASCQSVMKLKAVVRLGQASMWYPQISAFYTEIRKRYYWVRDEDDSQGVSTSEERDMQRAAYLFPQDTSHPISPKGRDFEGGSGYLITRILGESGVSTIPSLDLRQQDTFNERTTEPVTLNQLLSNRQAPNLPQRNMLLRDSYNILSSDIPKLDRLFISLPMNRANITFQQEYLTHLDASAQRVRVASQTTHRLKGKDLIDVLENHFTGCRVKYLTALNALKECLGPTTDPYQQTLSQFGQWPPITADVLLWCLASTSPINLPGKWKKCLISFALLLLDLQRARRLLRFALGGLEEEISKELENEGCDGWNAEEHPDWLLVQIQGKFLIRRAQAEIAMEMISPKSGRNTVMQVNMGEGKSSVIIPIVAATLADGKQLARVIVPKALTAQMFDLLVSRLGGLANRPIYHLPFSRSPEYSEDGLYKLMSQCMAERGILLVQPEHAVSLKLFSVETQICKGKPVTDPLSKLQKWLCGPVTTSMLLKSPQVNKFVDNMFRWFTKSANRSNQKDVTQAEHHDEHGMDAHDISDSATKWLGLQRWMDSHVRDILDESDEILHPRFQLIYTIGVEQHMDGYPDRWIITQQVLRLVSENAFRFSINHPNFIEYRRGPPGSFPYIHCVRDSGIGQRLVSLIVEDVMAGRLPGFSFHDISQELRDAVRSFISDENILQVPDTARRVEEYARGFAQGFMWTGLLLLRGLLASRILLFALAERTWRVDYGLVLQTPSDESADLPPTPTLLAVPYLAKDMPSPNTQFSHPDITIVLTCLSYYYSGLSAEQLRSSFENLLDQDDPSTAYALWIKDYDKESLPDSLRTLGEINLKSSEQWDKVIYPLFSRNQAAIDFYLSRVVFPKETKEFPWKLCASSWDLAEERKNVITGFSGTNDGRWLLPMSIAQQDLDHQQGTNVMVLAYLLQPENDFYMVTHKHGVQKTTHEFLSMVAVQRPEIHVLLDVGAQILDLSNIQVAKTWLDITRDAPGAVYFNENDELMVLYRNGTSIPMLSSPLAQQLDRCVVYLDHAHTRGTDVKLPIGSRAAITLGPKVTKDRLVQGCMRMRKLGHGHSVMFFAPPEVDLSIRSLTAKQDPNTQVTTVDVLCWAIHETWNDIHQRAPFWAQQGVSHKLRRNAWSRFCNGDLTSGQLSNAWLQPELKSLEDLYAPRENKTSSATLLALDPGIRQRCKDLGILSLPSAQMGEEQEREVNRQKEREREVELPPEAEPVGHVLHPDVVTFVKTGIIPPLNSSSAFRPVFTTLDKSSAATSEADVWSPSILATTDYCDTIEPESTEGTIDQFLRPVQWVLSSKGVCSQALVLVSPFEADRLMPDIKASEFVHLHVYAPRTSQCMKPSDDLKLYSTPPLPSDWTPPWALIDQLNVFAGQLYLRDYQSYLRLCQFLGVHVRELPHDGGVRWNVFNIPGSLEENEITFSGSPLPSVMALLAMRNRGRPFAHTHMGKILQGQLLREKDFEV